MHRASTLIPALALGALFLLSNTAPAEELKLAPNTLGVQSPSLTPPEEGGHHRGHLPTGKVTPGLGSAALGTSGLQLSTGIRSASKGPMAQEDWRTLFPKKDDKK